MFHWNVFTSQVRPQELSVDTYFYLETGREPGKFFSGEDSYIDPLRTPGYPLIILGLAWLQGVDLQDTGMSSEGWKAPNASGMALLRSLQVVQQALFFCLPLLLYGVFLLVSRSPLLGFLCSASTSLTALWSPAGFRARTGCRSWCRNTFPACPRTRATSMMRVRSISTNQTAGTIS